MGSQGGNGPRIDSPVIVLFDTLKIAPLAHYVAHLMQISAKTTKKDRRTSNLPPQVATPQPNHLLTVR